MNLLRKLEKGDTIGVFSSSSPTKKEALEKTKHYFESKSYRVKFTKNILIDNDYIAGEAEIRVKDFHDLVIDNDVKLIMTSTGGKGALQMLPLIDYNLLKSNPKIICGLSDPMSILNGITKQCQIPTFHGPNGYSFGHTDITKFSETNWWKIISGEFKTPFIN